MFGALIQVLLVFTGKTNPIPVFSIESPKLSLDAFLPNLPAGVTLPGGSTPSNQSIELISTKDFNRLLNMSATIFLMGFVLSFGYKIASLGINLLRPIIVKTSTTLAPVVPQPSTQ